VPVIAPVEVFSDRPVGRVPEVRDQVYGDVPPVAARFAVYALPTWPVGSDVVAITNAEGAAAPIVSVRLTV